MKSPFPTDRLAKIGLFVGYRPAPVPASTAPAAKSTARRKTPQRSRAK